MKHRKKVFYVVLGLLVWSFMVMRGAYALFSDTARLVDNSITTGTVNLLVSNSQSASSTIYEKEREGFALMINPGQSVDRYFLLKNASPADVAFDIGVNPLLPNGPSDLLERMTIEIVPVDANGVPLPGVEPIQGPIGTLSNRVTPITGHSLAKGATQRYRLRQTVGAGVTVQGETLTYSLVLTGTQRIN